MGNIQPGSTWNILKASVRGASHERIGLPNQDAINEWQDERVGLPLVLAVSDGHGSAKYFRSELGSNFAVKIATEEMLSFLEGSPPNPSNLSVLKRLADEKLPYILIDHWKKMVTDHLQKYPFTDDDWKRLPKEESTARQTLEANPTIAYGATLLIVLVTEHFILYMQLGDGDILTVSETGEVSRPLPRDDRHFANETTSLCSSKAWRDFHVHFQVISRSGGLPALILLSTDGYANSFRNEEEFVKVGSDLLQIIRTNDLEKVKASLKGWLEEASHIGSGDDITLGIICHMEGIRRSIISPSMTSGASSNRDAVPTPYSHIQGDSNTPRQTNPLGHPQTHSIGSGNIDPDGHLQPSSSQSNIVFSKTQQTDVTIRSDPNILSPTPNNTPTQSYYVSQTQDLVQRPQQFLPTALPKLQQGMQVSQQRLTVAKQGGDYTRISDAVKNAQLNAQIFVKPGKYEDKVVIDKPVKIIGDGPLQDVIIENTNAPCILMQTGSAELQNLMIHGYTKSHVFGKSRERYYAVDISGGQLDIIRCDIRSDSIACVGIHGANANARLFKCLIHDGNGSGILFDEGSSGIVEACTIFKNAHAGVEMRRAGNLTIRGGEIYGGQGVGILISDKSGGIIEDVDIYDNIFASILINQSSNPFIHRCKIHHGKGPGIYVGEGGTGRVIDCDIYDNTSAGVQIGPEGSPTIQICRIYRNHLTAISVIKSGRGTVENCDLTGNAQGPWEIEDREASKIYRTGNIE